MTTICLPDAAAKHAVGQIADVDVVVWDGSDPPPRRVDDVEFLVPGYMAAGLTAERLAELPNLRVIQLLSAGVEPWLDRVPPGVMLCDGRGIHGASTAELALAGLLTILRELPMFRAEQTEHRWAHKQTEGLDGRSVLVLGAGDIGKRVGAAVEAFGATVTFLARHARAGVRPMTELTDLLPGHDVVVVALPHTPHTEGLVDAAFLAAMPDGAVFVNIARGTIVHTEALVAELQSGRLRAFLDVTDPEPLPPDHPLWDAPNVTITPHVGGGTNGWERRAYTLVRDQVIRFRDGERLLNEVTDGY